MHRSGLIELEAVLAVARRRSFRAAALDLGMSTSALSNAVIGIEERLGIRLFNRTTRSVGLTEAGEHFVDQIAPAVADIRLAMDIANNRRASPKGRLRINSSVGAARRILAPLIVEFLRRHPDMEVVIATEGRLVDIVAEGWDAGIRPAEAVPRDMVSVPLGDEVRFVVVATPSDVAAYGAPATPGDLLQHECVRARMPSGSPSPWEFSHGSQDIAIDVPGRLTLDEPNLMLEAARSGFGLAYVAGKYAEDDLVSGRLVQLLPDWMPPPLGLCLYHAGRRHVPAGLRALVHLIKEQRAQGDPTSRQGPTNGRCGG
jgi:DNA-binding transcriptional LysR family regulator